MTIQYLLLNARVGVPDSASLITTCRDDLITLRIKLNLRYFILMTLEESSAGTCEDVVDASQAVGRCSRQLVACIVEGRVEHFVVVSLESLDTLPRCHVP